MKIPVIKPLWKLSGKISEKVVELTSDFYKKAGLCAAALLMVTLSVLSAVNPQFFAGIFTFGPHIARADSTPNTALAEYSGNIRVQASSLNNYYNSIESFSMDTTPLIGGYFINNDLTGSAIADAQGYNVPFMPPSGNDTSNWYFWQPTLQQGRTYNYTLYTGTNDLSGDIVYFPSSAGMTVNASNTLNFGSNDFTINISGFFDKTNTGSDDIIFQNDQFSLQYSNGQLILSNGSGGIVQTQVATLGGYTLQNGVYSTLLNNTSNAIVTMAVKPTSSVATAQNSTVLTNTAAQTTTTSSVSFSTLYANVTVYYTYVTRQFTTNNTTRLTTNVTGNTTSVTGDIPILFDNYTTTVSGNGVTTVILNGQGTTTKTLTAGAVPGTATNQTTYANTVSSKTGTPVSTVISSTTANGYDYTTYYTTRVTNNTTIYSSKSVGNITNVTNAGQVGDRIGLMYYNIPSNTYSANWDGGDTTLTVSRSGNTLTVSNGSTLLMSIPVAADPVATDGTANWTIAQQGAMKYLRSMTIENNGTDVASWEWEAGDTFTDATGTGNTAYPNFITASIPNNSTTTFSGYRAIDNQTTTTSTTSTTTSISGIIDTETPDSDINRNIDESKWENIFLFGMFYKLAQEGGIPPSLFFIPLFGFLAIIAFGVAYHFTRDILVSGIAGNAALGLGISMSVLYTIPLILGIVIMLVLLVKRKTVSL